jgi:general secretion pathway protein D
MTLSTPIKAVLAATVLMLAGVRVHADVSSAVKLANTLIPISASDGQIINAAHFEVDATSKSLIVTTDAETNKIIQRILSELDKPVPQVLIKVQFVEVTHGSGRDMGVEATYSNTKDNGDASIISSIVGASNITQGGTVGLLSGDLDITLKALAEASKMEVLSRPSIMARSNEEATITVGQEVPFVTNSQVSDEGTITNTIEYEDIGIILKVTPDIAEDGMVKMVVAPEISTITGDYVTISEGVEAPTFAKRSAETTVSVPSGQTVVIGGLMDTQETKTQTKVPILGDIPLLGWFFRRTVTSNDKTELLIFLTPQVVTTHQENADLSESETSSAASIREMLEKRVPKKVAKQP